MAAQLIDGKQIASELLDSIKQEVNSLGSKPRLDIVLVGNNPASKVYVGKKEQACKKVGIDCHIHKLDKTVDEAELLSLVEKLNERKDVTGVLVQNPLPKHINEQLIVDAINPFKDVDGFTPMNLGNMFIGNELFVPATPKGVVKLIESTNQPIEGKHAVIVGRSNNVGKPVGLLLLAKHATVTLCHSKTENLREATQKADILVVAVGKPEYITKEMVKSGAIVIDVGINKKNGKLVGDVAKDVEEVAGFLTPVPGGVGPMTVAMLLQNVLRAHALQG